MRPEPWGMVEACAGRAGQPGPGEGAAELCPVCQEALGAELAMLPCGHQLCVRCQMALIDRLPSNVPRARSLLPALAEADCRNVLHSGWCSPYARVWLRLADPRSALLAPLAHGRRTCHESTWNDGAYSSVLWEQRM